MYCKGGHFCKVLLGLCKLPQIEFVEVFPEIIILLLFICGPYSRMMVNANHWLGYDKICAKRNAIPDSISILFVKFIQPLLNGAKTLLIEVRYSTIVLRCSVEHLLDVTALWCRICGRDVIDIYAPQQNCGVVWTDLKLTLVQQFISCV